MGIKCKTLYNSIKRNKPYFEDFITRSIYNSNAIEGNTLSYYDTYALVFNDNTILTAKPREIYEAINLKYAFNYILQTIGKPLSVDNIRQVGIFINKNINDIDDFRKTQVFIKGVGYIPPDASYVPSLISELVYGMKKSNYDLIFKYMADFHLQFERIHPFTDGNGRTGRLLVSKLCIDNGIAPIVVPLEMRSEYMNYLASQNVNGLASMFEKLSIFEENRMAQFGVKLK